MEAFAVPFLLAVGSLLALQAAANVQLSHAVGSPFGASTLQLALGAALLLALAAAVGPATALDGLDDVPAWHLVGGLGSALYITAGILLFPRVGAVVAVGLFVAGQMGASLLIDSFGWLGVEPEPVGPVTAAGGAAVVAGAALVVRAQVTRRPAPGWMALGLAAGAVLPFQGAINARLRADLDTPLATGAFSFLVATAAMALFLAVATSAARAAAPRLRGLRDLPWWGWLGGACGATYVTAVFVLIPEIGAAPTIALTIAGQQLASLAVDRHGLLRLPRRPVSHARLAGVGLLLAGVGLLQLAG
jgi:bacterial/archaeal transporter family-2 protein